MRGILLISHGQYAEAFKGSLKMIAGEVTNLSLLLPAANGWPGTVQGKTERAEAGVGQVRRSSGLCGSVRRFPMQHNIC